MRSLFKVVLLLSLPYATFLPFPEAQAKVPSQTCVTLSDSDLGYVNWYPPNPLPVSVATDAVGRRLAKLEAIAASPSSLNLTIERELTQWLFEKPDLGGADIGSRARMHGLLKVLPNNQKPKLVAIFDQLALRIEKLPSPSLRAEMTGKLASYYQKLQGNERAAQFLNRAITKTLNSTDKQVRAVQLTKLLDAVVELKLSKAIAPQLPQIERALQSSTPSVSLARAFADNNQSQKALKLADRFAKATKAEKIVNSDLITLYLQLNKLELANQNLKRISPANDAAYGRLVAAYDRAKQTKLADKLFKDGFDSFFDTVKNDAFLDGYLKAGGNPDRLFTGVPVLQAVGVIDLRGDYSLRAAGEYRRLNQPQKAQRVIAEFVQLAAANNLVIDDILMAAITDGNQQEAKAAFQQLLEKGAFVKVEPPINFATQINALDQIAPFIKRASKNNERRIELLQSLALAYAKQQQANKAVSIAEQIPRRSPEYSTAIDTLAQVAAVFGKSGQKTEATTIFAKALSLSSNIKELDTRAMAYTAIARAYTDAGDTSAAETTRQAAVKLALSLPNDPNLSVNANYMLSLISQQFLNANQVEAAWKMLQEIPKDAYKNTNTSNLISTALALGNLSIAQQAVDLEYTDGRLSLFPEEAFKLASSYIGRNRQKEAIKLLDQAADVMNKQLKPEPSYLISIVRLYAQAGRIDAARQMLSKLPSSYTGLRQELQQYIDCHQKA
ncbi:hypothetical protein DSM106972_049140 [Dulcicalothrix desertica PCC 7102]|uniref:Tetratricopeptide repeat-like domain-containing protein n=1 Tax=Dulcicalothrix desertica PCC 7102 TaxID=232991 RepID=A0A3S1AM21_9CYAN|nr:hypothetical protein [Dulcicalothrix desertica]RUT04000.1 hypothetical protein DSM106972_049140 [Dulcicalothrix desertica PCC 7102]TWH43595.1 hypothetical protein CAL7102_07331 [Dulcicalothrix desertica PCC 7102]